MVASIVTLFSGLIFIQTDNREIFSIIVFTIVVVVNVRFYLLWFIVAVTIYRKYKVLNLVSVWMRRTFCIKMTQVLNLISIRFAIQSNDWSYRILLKHSPFLVYTYVKYLPEWKVKLLILFILESENSSNSYTQSLRLEYQK